MCLAVPMEVREIYADGTGSVEAEGVSIKADLRFIEHCRPGDFVIIHAGFAIEKIDRDEAESRIRLFQELASAYQEKDQ